MNMLTPLNNQALPVTVNLYTCDFTEKERIMIRNVCATNSDVTEEKNCNTPATEIPDECRKDLIRAMKIGYYKEFYKQGLISSEELNELLKMQNTSEISERTAA